jgi:spore cortex formation protein SpoVR/YcgB (stage V sporulation)
MIDYCTPVYGKERVEKITDYILNLEDQQDVNGLNALLV